MKPHFLNKGFTLVELMLVIAIIGLLSSLVLASLKTARDRAMIAKSLSDISQITKAIAVAQSERGRPLYAIATTDCGQCHCEDINSARCYNFWVDALTQIQAATNGTYTDLVAKFSRDPWGNPYQIDANQGVNGVAACSSYDGLWAYGQSQSIFPKIPLSGICP